jgi:SAM-dependent methyltransferase
VEPYSDDYFELLREGALSSARVVAPLVVELVQPRSVIDVGCGTGEWLKSFSELGVEDYLGVDAADFDTTLLSIPHERFLAHDLREPLLLDRRFDLALCMEVAEHLPPERAEGFVEELCTLAPVVLFSAAPPGGAPPEVNGHLNERWQSWWADLFDQRGFEPVDCVRPETWEDPRVDFWYAQDAILYVSRERLTADDALRAAQERYSIFPLSVHHPKRNSVSGRAFAWHKAQWAKRRKAMRERIKRLEVKHEQLSKKHEQLSKKQLSQKERLRDKLRRIVPFGR